MSRIVLRGRTLSFHREPTGAEDHDAYSYHEDGAVLIEDGRILATDGFDALDTDGWQFNCLNHDAHQWLFSKDGIYTGVNGDLVSDIKHNNLLDAEEYIISCEKGDYQTTIARDSFIEAESNSSNYETGILYRHHFKLRRNINSYT